MGDDRRWMYDGWKRNEAHTDEWWDKTNDFIECALSLATTEKIRCPCVKCQNVRCFDKVILTKHLIQNGFTVDYETWVFQGKKYTAVAVEESANDRAGADRMDEMLEVIRPEFDLDIEDPPTPEVEEFFRLLKALEEPLHKHTKVIVLAFVTRLMAIKSKFFFSNNCYNKLLKLVRDVLPNPNKLPKDIYHSKKLVKGLDMDYEKIDICRNSCMLFWKEHKEENKCLKYGKPRYVKVINDDGEIVTIEVARKQLRYMPFAPRLKQMFLSERIAIHMRWHKDGERENKEVMVHPSDSDAWKTLDNFDPEFARGAKNIHIGLATDGFTPFGDNAASHSYWPVFAIPYNLRHSLCMKYEFMFLCLVISSLDHSGPKLNVMLKPLIDELKELWNGVKAYDSHKKQKFTLWVVYL
jgi:hypothetical protein